MTLGPLCSKWMLLTRSSAVVGMSWMQWSNWTWLVSLTRSHHQARGLGYKCGGLWKAEYWYIPLWCSIRESRLYIRVLYMQPVSFALIWYLYTKFEISTFRTLYVEYEICISNVDYIQCQLHSIITTRIKTQTQTQRDRGQQTWRMLSYTHDVKRQCQIANFYLKRIPATMTPQDRAARLFGHCGAKKTAQCLPAWR